MVTPFSLTERVVVVTGGGTGLGARTAVALAEAGAHVVITGRRLERLEQTVSEILAAGGSAEAYSVDIQDRGAVRELFARLRASHESLDVLVNNAAVVHEATVLDVDDVSWESVIGTNLTGLFACTQEFARQDPDRDRAVVNVSSIVGTSGVTGQAAYSASKGGVESLTRALAVELARRRIRVNAVAPGYMLTDMPAQLMEDPAAASRLLTKIPMRRLAEPAEVAPVLVFLASPASSYMTGVVMAVDGGYAAK